MEGIKVLGIGVFLLGVFVVFLAKILVEKLNLKEKMTCNFEDSMTEEERHQYRLNKAVVNVKMMGLLVALPGIILIYYAFK